MIMTGPLKTEGMLASTVSPSNVVITPTPIARVRALARPRPPNACAVAWLLGGPRLT